MGLVHRLYGDLHCQAQKAAVDAVFELLRSDNARADRKERDAVYATEQAIIITSWGIDPDEVFRKQSLAAEMIAKTGLKIEDKGTITWPREVVGGTEGTLIIPAYENGGFGAIAARVAGSGLAPYHMPPGLAQAL